MSDQKKPFARLPTTVTPTNYKITLKPDFESLTFEGNQSIAVRVNEETDRVVLNANELQLTSSLFTDEKGQTLKSVAIEPDLYAQTVAIVFGSRLSIGTGTLAINYTGILNDRLCGFYRCRYVTQEGEERYGASTHFEATDARRAFPCWDEPALKATFDVTLVVPDHMVALSNMNVISDKSLDSGLKEVKFATTPMMSTYLVAVIVGGYDFVEGKTKEGVVVRAYTPIGKKDQGLFALEVGLKALDFYTDYFKVGYPLPKVDLVAVPELKIGAMENWGLVTYREAALLVDPHNTSASRKQLVAIIVAHELSHKWFGNLVTMEWWTDLWLKEGFASFMENLCVDNLFPDYNVWTQFVSDAYTAALTLDALHNSHPIEVPVGHPSEIDEIFDTISYDKGSSVIRMLYHYVGDEAFRKGLNQYLIKYSYKNTRTEDLWDALQEASDMPVRDVMSTWTKQKGFPLISVTTRIDGKSLVLSLTQEKFCADGKLPESERNTQWLIPIDVIRESQDSKPMKTLIKTKTVDFDVLNVESNEWIKFNSNAIGFYRVHYPPELMERLLRGISDKSVSALDRLSLHNDLVALVQAGRAPTSQVLQMMTAYAAEENYTVWQSIDDCLSKLAILLAETDLLPHFRKYGRSLLTTICQRLGWEPVKGETHMNTLLRSLVISRLVGFEDPNVVSMAKELFKEYLSGRAVITPDLRSAIYRAVAIDCDDQTFETFFRLYRETELQEEKNRLSRAMGSVKDQSRLLRVLEFSLSKEVKNQDTVFVIMMVSMNNSGRQLAWQFFKDNKDELKRRYEGGTLLSRLVKFITENFTSEEKAREVTKFFSENPMAGTERAIKQSVEKILLNAEWINRDAKDIDSYLSTNWK